MTQAFKEAIQTGRAILKDKWSGSNANIVRGQGLTELRCPGCGVVIKKMLPAGPQDVTRVRNQTFIFTQTALCALANYREVLFEMTNGRHVAAVCIECAKHVHDPMFATAIYAANLAQFSAEGQVIPDSVCNRGPVSVLKIADQINE